jgi:hypothetical protein
MPCKSKFPVLGAVLTLAALFMAGCSSTASPGKSEAGAPAMADGRCHAEAAQFTVGKPLSAALLEQARTRSGSQMARALGPHDMITMDYRSERLNLNVDDQGVVRRANCG